jgi:tetratricopeptide (TPR) repeat protein
MQKTASSGPSGEDFRNLGVQLREIGHFEVARKSLEHALAINPTDGRAHRYLIEIQNVDEREFHAHIREMRNLLDAPGLDDGDRLELHFALGGALDQLKRYDDAFEHFCEGNSLRRRDLSYDEALERAHFDLLARTFDPTIARLAVAGPPDARPIFVVGMPRSGTTLVESLLAPHPDVHALGELTAFEQALFEFAPIDASPNDHAAFLSAVRGEIRQLGERYLRAIDAAAPDARKTVDKMPANFRYVVPIHLALPAAKIIHVRRDPIDTSFSCYATNFAEGQHYSYDIGEMSRYYQLYESHMNYARTILPAGVMLDLDYEDLVADVESGACRILEHCGLDWHPAILEYRQHERPVRTASVVQVRRPIYLTSVGRAKHYPAFCQDFIAAR